MEKYYTKEQLDQLANRREELGAEEIQRAERRWPELIAQVRHARDTGLDPNSGAVRDLADEWQELIEAFTGGDTGITESLGNAWKQEEAVAGFDTRDIGELAVYLGIGWTPTNVDQE